MVKPDKHSEPVAPRIPVAPQITGSAGCLSSWLDSGHKATTQINKKMVNKNKALTGGKIKKTGHGTPCPQFPSTNRPAGNSTSNKNTCHSIITQQQSTANAKNDNKVGPLVVNKQFYGGKKRRAGVGGRKKRRGGFHPCQGSKIEFDDLQLGEKYCFDPIAGHGELVHGLYSNTIKPLKGVIGTLFSKIKSGNTNIIWMELPGGNKWGEQFKRAQTVYKYAPEKGDWRDHGKYDIEPEMTDSEDDDDEIVDILKGGKVDKRTRKNIKTKSRKTRRKHYKRKSKKRKHKKKTKKRKRRS